jgi:hypothetical protein
MKEYYTTTVTTNNAGDVIEQSETTSAGQESSVELSELANGKVKITVKVYHADAAVASEEAVAIFLDTRAALDAQMGVTE